MMKNKEDKMNIKLSEFQYDDDSQLFRLPEQIRHLEEKYTYSDGKIEKYILSAIKNATDISDDSEELMRLSKDWPSYYHLGIGRSNIIKCLDLNKQINVLELGSGCGAISRCLGERFESVDCVEGSFLRAKITRERCIDLNNVRVFCSDIKRVEFEPMYDVVTLIGVLEYAPVYFPNDNNINPFHTFVEIAKRALKPDGVLIIAIENKIGLKYWSGCPEDHTGKIYDGIHGYPVEGTAKTFSKSEINDLLNEMGFSNINYYYSFPDYKFATDVLSDNGDERTLHLHNWINVPFKSYNNPRISTFEERLALKTLSDAGLLKEFANSFLVVAGNNSAIAGKPDWAVKKFTQCRVKDYQCVTTLKLTPEPYVEKIRLNGSNDRKNIGIVRSKDIQLNISHNISNSTWYKGDSLILKIHKALYKDNFVDELSKILQEFQQTLFKLYSTGENDEDGYPLLQGCALDIMCRNIIVNDSNELIPFDTEWQVDGSIPADYVSYRCLRYDIASIANYKIGDLDKFIINQQKKLFPQYGRSRNKRNQDLENSFQKRVSNNIGIENLIVAGRFSQIIHNKIIWDVIIKLWNKMPSSIKKQAKHILRI